jgi:hypothetical protein
MEEPCLPVASLDDPLQGKLWAAQDATRHPSKRQKDLADIACLKPIHTYEAASQKEFSLA